MNSPVIHPARAPAATRTTTLLCFIVALLEGIDIQSSGIAGPGIAARFGLDQAELGWVFSASLVGLLFGAFAGGWLSDWLGRKQILTGSVALFGLFSLLTTQSWNLDSLLVARFMTGLGLGATLPNLIALTSEAADRTQRATAVSLMYCGVPLGGALASLAGMYGGPEHWQLVFHIGGWAPLLVAPLLQLCLPDPTHSQVLPGERRIGVHEGLFQDGQAVSTLLLWLSCFFTLMVVYLLLNWLPSLLIGQGFSRIQAGSVQLLLNLGMALGSVLAGVLLDRWRPTLLVGLIYAGILLALAGLGSLDGFIGMLLVSFAAGFFVLAAQLVLYALAPQFYPAGIRATGIGSAVAVGRLGSIGGPLVAGQMLAAGSGSAGLMAVAAPGVAIAAACVILLLRRKPANDD